MDFAKFPFEEVLNQPYDGSINGMPSQGVITSVVPDDGHGRIVFRKEDRIAFFIYPGSASSWRREESGSIVIRSCGFEHYRIRTNAST